MNIMTKNGSIVPHRTFIPLTMAKVDMSDMKRQHIISDNLIRKEHGDSMNLSPWQVEADKKLKAIERFFISYKNGESEPRLIPKNDVIDMNISLVDTFVNAEDFLPQGEESEAYKGSNLVQAKVIRHFCDKDGNIMGKANVKPELNTMTYEVEFPDCEI